MLLSKEFEEDIKSNPALKEMVPNLNYDKNETSTRYLNRTTQLMYYAWLQGNSRLFVTGEEIQKAAIASGFQLDCLDENGKADIQPRLYIFARKVLA